MLFPPGCTSPPLKLAQVLHQRTQGNPLFLVNMLDELLKQQDEQPAAHHSLSAQVKALQIPDNIRQLIDYQLDSLHLGEQQLLEAASLAGMQFSTATVAAGFQANVETVERSCQKLAQHSLFLHASDSQSSDIQQWPDGTLTQHYQFRHALYQEVLAERLIGARRVNIHRRIGQRLEIGYAEQTDEIAAEIAFHYEQAHDYQQAVHFHKQAGENAVRRFAHHEAISHFTHGLELLTKLPHATEDHQELQLQIALGSLLPLAEGYTVPAVEAVYARALELCQKFEDTPHLFASLFGLVRYYALRGVLQTAAELSERLLALARQQDTRFLPTAYTTRAGVLFFLGQCDEAKTYAERGIQSYDVTKHGTLTFVYGEDPGTVSFSFQAYVLWYLGYPDRALEAGHRAFALAQAISHPFNITFVQIAMNWVHSLRGEVKAAQEWIDSLITFSTQKEFPVWLAPGSFLRGWGLIQSGQQTQGLTLMNKGLEQIKSLGVEVWGIVYRILLAEVYLRMGRLEDARHAIEETFTKTKTIGECFHTSELYRVYAELLLAESVSQAKEADTCFQQAIEISQRQHAKSLELRAATSLARLWQQQGKITEARQLLAEIYDWFTEGFDTADLQQARALLDDLS